MARIVSPIPYGCGVYALHKTIAEHFPDYIVRGYNPYFEFTPFLFPFLISTKDADLIHTTPDYGLFFHKNPVPLVLTVHHYMCDGAMDIYSSLWQKIHYRTDLKWFFKKSISLATAITAVSRYSADHIKKELGITKEIRIIYNGIDSAFYKPDREKKNTSANIRVLFSGNHSRRKGFHWLPQIAARLAPGIFIYCTGGLRKTKNIQWAHNLHSLGNIASEDMPTIYNQYDMLLSPAVREGFGLAIAEAMACGLPVVASNCSAIPELIDDGKGGFLCPVGDVDAFAEKINLLAASPALRTQMGAYNREKIETSFKLETMVDNYKKLFDEVLGSNAFLSRR